MGKHKIKRSEEREFAFKMLYASEFNDESYESQIKRLDRESQEKATAYVDLLISQYKKHKVEFDQQIKEMLENWELNRVAVIDKVILRMAIAEIFYFDDIPPRYR